MELFGSKRYPHNKMKMKGISKAATVALSLFWLTPTYICAAGRNCSPFTSMHVQSNDCCSHQSCDNPKSTKNRSVPCHPNSICGIQQNVLTLAPYSLEAPAMKAGFILVLQDSGIRLSATTEFSSDGVQALSRGQPGYEFYSNTSTLSPPSLA